MALLIGGAFLITQNNNNAKAANADYYVTFSDNFDRSDGVIGNNWVDRTTMTGCDDSTNIVSNQIVINKTSTGYNPVCALLRPTTEEALDQKVTIDLPNGTQTDGAKFSGVVARSTFYSPPNSVKNGVVAFVRGDNTFTIGKWVSGAPTYETYTNLEFGSHSPSDPYRLELTVEDTGTVNVQAKVIHIASGDVVGTKSAAYTDANLSLPGSAGFYYGAAAGSTQKFDNFSVSDPVPTSFTMTPDQTSVGVGKATTFEIFGPASTIALSDGGAGGTFSSSSVSLNVGNLYRTVFTYTPSRTGSIVITATPSAGSAMTSTIFANPYSTAIGFIGDSLTYLGPPTGPFVDQLGDGYSAVNHGSGGTSSWSWATNQSSLMTNALSDFSTNDVEVVSIMLGANDASTFTAEQYKGYMTTIIETLKNSGIKKIILNLPTYRENYEAITLQYHDVLKSLVDGNTVMLGDDAGFNYFAAHPEEQNVDRLHLNATGIETLGGLWAAAYNRVIIEPLSVVHTFTGANVGTFTKESTTGLEYTVTKDFHWFNEGGFAGVLVDGTSIDTAKYTATPGSTVITLAPAYLDTLAVGSHNLTVRFTDGVNFTSPFTIAAANPGGNNNGGSNGSGVPGAPNTGLFGMSANTTIAGFVILTIVTALGAVLVGRKLALNRR
jgi:lysophospholipase L1-like esterase